MKSLKAALRLGPKRKGKNRSTAIENSGREQDLTFVQLAMIRKSGMFVDIFLARFRRCSSLSSAGQGTLGVRNQMMIGNVWWGLGFPLLASRNIV